MIYGFSDLEALWQEAGGSAQLAPVMAAIALAESGGDPGAINPKDNGGTQTSWGLWQISDGTHNSFAGWNDPLVNAQAAVAKLQSQGLSAWGTYTSGAYQEFLSGAGAVSGWAGAAEGAAAYAAAKEWPVSAQRLVAIPVVLVLAVLLIGSYRT